MAPSRRALLKGAGFAGLYGLLPRLAQARTLGGRRFLFVFCPGGWDPTLVFAPVFGSDLVDMPERSTAATIADLPFVDSEDRPAVREFFARWAGQSVLLNGIEVRSINHHVCKRLILTGSPAEVGDDWAAALAGHALDDPPMPAVHLSGPSFAHNYGAAVVRVGDRGQLVNLQSGAALESAGVTAPAAAVEAAIQAHLMGSLSAGLSTAGLGAERRLYAGAVAAQERLLRLGALGDTLTAAVASSFPDRLAVLTDLLEQGAIRCGSVAFEGYLDLGWDTHAANKLQSPNFDLLFSALDGLCTDLAARVGPGGDALIDEVTVVVLSEMGRYPLLNGHGGKEHWTFTSALLIGGGLAGGRAIGGWSSALGGEAVDLSSGALDPGGELLLPAHLGATLLALGDVDPEELLPGVSPIWGALA